MTTHSLLKKGNWEEFAFAYSGYEEGKKKRHHRIIANDRTVAEIKI